MITDPDSGLTEATVVINGKQLSLAESMALRVAVTGYAMMVSETSFAKELGPIANGYRHQLRAIFEKMVTP
jgi:hypothetical protein